MKDIKVIVRLCFATQIEHIYLNRLKETISGDMGPAESRCQDID